MDFELRALVVGSGFEPLKAKPADLQSAPIGRSGNPPVPSEDGPGRIQAPGGGGEIDRRTRGRQQLRHREQGGSPGGRQRPQPGSQGDSAALRLQGNRCRHFLERREHRHQGKLRGARKGCARCFPDQAHQARHLAKVA